MNQTVQKSFPVTWDQFHRDSRALAWRLQGQGPFEAVIAIARGGLVPAAIVARANDPGLPPRFFSPGLRRPRGCLRAQLL